MSAGTNGGTRGFIPVSSEDRIKELNAIDHDISQLLACASKAIGLLPNDDYDEPNPRLEDVKDKFQQASSDYFSTLSSVEVRLRRQIYALDEAGLIAKGTRQDADRATSMNEDQTSRRAGGGPLDSSWLNARAKDSSGQALKREALDEAKLFLKRSGIEVEGERNDTMEVDSEDG